jgi:hypothetical protein
MTSRYIRAQIDFFGDVTNRGFGAERCEGMAIQPDRTVERKKPDKCIDRILDVPVRDLSGNATNQELAASAGLVTRVDSICRGYSSREWAFRSCR